MSPTTEEFETRSLTLVVQGVIQIDDAFTSKCADALAEYVDDCRAGRAGCSIFERHVQKNGFRIDAIASVPPIEGGAAVERVVDGDGNDALKERLLSMRRAAEFLPGGKDCNDIASFAMPPAEAAQQVRDLIGEQLAALGVKRESRT